MTHHVYVKRLGLGVCYIFAVLEIILMQCTTLYGSYVFQLLKFKSDNIDGSIMTPYDVPGICDISSVRDLIYFGDYAYLSTHSRANLAIGQPSYVEPNQFQRVPPSPKLDDAMHNILKIVCSEMW
jgi:hypothetical protein